MVDSVDAHTHRSSPGRSLGRDRGAALLAIVYLGFMSVVASIRRRRRRKTQGLPARLKFTREGKSVVAIALGVGIAAINTGNNMLYLFLGMMLSLIIISGIHFGDHNATSHCNPAVSEQIFAEKPVLVSLSLQNQKTLVPSYGIQVADRSSAQEKSKRCFFLKVGARDEQVTNYRLEFSHRGRYQFQRMTIITRFPFAFFVKQRSVEARAEVTVFPAVFPIDIARVVAHAGLGQRMVDAPGQGRDFHALDEYRTGHNARDIHWRRSASAPFLVRREYASEEAPSTTIFLNDILHEDGSDAAEVERLVSMAASLVVAFQSAGKKCSLVTRREHVPVDADGGGLRDALTLLATLDFEPAAQSGNSVPDLPEEHCLVVTLSETQHTLPTGLIGAIWQGTPK